MNKPTLNQNYITAVDMGSSKIACMVAEIVSGKLELKGYKIHKSDGIKNGQIIDIDIVRSDLAKVMDETETMAGSKGNIVVVNAAVNNLASINLASEINVSGRPISDNDIDRLIKGCVSHFNVPDYQIIHCIPTGYNVDDLDQVKEPRGMYGGKLGIQVHIISANKWHLKNLETVVGNTNAEEAVIVATPYASALSCLSDYEKDLGTIMIDMGAGTTSICVFFNSQIVFTYVFPIGGANITKAIAQRLTISLRQAEKLKISEGSAFLVSTDKHELINVPDEDGQSYTSIKKSELTNVIASGVEEIFEMIKTKLKEEGLYQLPTRIVLTGGGAQLHGVKELGSAILERTVITKQPVNIINMPQKISTGSFSACCGLLQFVLENPKLFVKKKDFKFKQSKIFKWFLQNF